MTPFPGTVHTASSANIPRSAKPSFRVNASKIRRTIASFSAAATPLLPAGDEAVDVSSLSGGEGDQRDEPTSLGRVVAGDSRLEMLTLRRRLAKLPVQPAQQAHSRLVGHEWRLSGLSVRTHEVATRLISRSEERPRACLRPAHRPSPRLPLPRQGCTR